MGWLSRRNAKPFHVTPSTATVLVGGVGSVSAIVAPSDHEVGWEQLYLASEIARGLGELDDEYRRYMSGEVVSSGATVADPLVDAPVRSREIAAVIAQIDSLFAPELLEKAFGPAGTAGDETTIRAVASGVVGVFRSCLRWGEQIRGTAVPIEWQPVYSALADSVTLPMEQILEFSSKLSVATKETFDAIRSGKPPAQRLELVLRISIDPTVTQRFQAALEVVKRSRNAASD